MPNVWAVRASGGALTAAFVRGGYASVGYGMDIDLSTVTNYANVETLYRQKHPETLSNYKIGQEVGQLHRFLHVLKADDYVITPAEQAGVLRYGILSDDAPYFTDGGDAEDTHTNRRQVQWSPDKLLRSQLSVPFQRSLAAPRTVFSLERHEREFFENIGRDDLALEQGAPAPDEHDPYNTAIMRLLELDPDEFEDLVGVLLAAMGFEQVRVTGKSGDGGVDVIGVLHASTLADVRLFVQVKRHQQSNKVNKAAVQQVRAGIPFGGNGAIITTSSFAKPAIEAANEPDYPRVGLTDGAQLVDLLLEYWAELPSEFQEKLGLKPGLVLA